MYRTVNESPAHTFTEQMRVRKQIALEEWREPRLSSFNGGSLTRDEYIELHPALRLPFSDYWQKEQNHLLYGMTANCIRELAWVRRDAEN